MKPSDKRLSWGLGLVLAITGACATGQVSQDDGPGGSGLNPNETAPGTVIPDGRGIVGGPGNQATLVGRFDMTDPNLPVLSLPNCKIGVRFTGSNLGVRFAATGYDLLNVSVDGATPTVVSINPSVNPMLYIISTSLTPGAHTVWFSKRTEPYQRDQNDMTRLTGALTFGGLVIGANEGILSPPQTKPRLIETLGDSGYTGYGIDGTPPCVYTIEQQDADKSVPALLAAALGAEVSNISISGKGIYNSQNDPNDFNNMIPHAYVQTTPPSPTPVWQGGSPKVDAVVVDIGSNDLFGTYGSGYFPDPNAVFNAYVGLLGTIRTQHPSAHIFCATSAGSAGADRTKLMSTIADAISARHALGDAQVESIDYFANDPNGWQTYSDASSALGLGVGCQGHPSPAGAKFLAERLAPTIRSRMGW